MARFHRYSANNILLIHVQRRDATRVAGFSAWRKLGRFVRRGEKGIAILVPMTLRRSLHEAGNDVGADDATTTRTILGFKPGYVFDGLSRDSGSRGPGGIRAEMLLLNAPSGVETGEGVTKQQAVLVLVRAGSTGPRGEGAKRPIAGWRARSHEQRRVG